jgi:hypothetical protein
VVEPFTQNELVSAEAVPPTDVVSTVTVAVE